MHIWAKKTIGLSAVVQLAPGWNDVNEDDLDELTENQEAYGAACGEEGLIKYDPDDETGPVPGTEMPEEPDAPRSAKEMIVAIEACNSAEQLDALGADDDARTTVKAAYDQAVERLAA